MKRPIGTFSNSKQDLGLNLYLGWERIYKALGGYKPTLEGFKNHINRNILRNEWAGVERRINQRGSSNINQRHTIVQQSNIYEIVWYIRQDK